MEKYLYIPTPNKYAGRRRPLRLIVWHSTESAEKQGGAHNVAAGWFAKASSKVSAHITVDDGSDPRYPSGVCESVYPWDTAWHASNANADGYGIEIIGRAAQSGSEWRDKFSLAAIENACAWVKWNDRLRIPARWLTDAQVKSGAAGHVTHAQIYRLMGGSYRTDPGANFPYSYVMDLLGDRPASTPVPAPPGAPRVPSDNYPILKVGMADSPAVRRYQAFCNKHDWTPDLPLLKVDGDYGPATVNVTRLAQKQMGVTGPDADGTIVGPKTNAALARRGYGG